MEEQIKVTLYGLLADPVSNTPVMILKPEKEEKLFPIWIGTFEANAISMELEKIKSPRPMTHDLISDIIYSFNGNLEKVLISDMEQTTFYAKLFLKTDNDVKVIDCRPSDAITLALKYNTSIYIDKNVYKSYTLSDQQTCFLNEEARYNNWFLNENISSDSISHGERRKSDRYIDT